MRSVLLVSLFLLTGCSVATTQAAPSHSSLLDRGPAPELTNQTWLNTPTPLRLANLRGKVVLLEMWTFDCINCRHTIPELNAWYKSYTSQGLVIIGNHYPEFPYEADLGNLKKAVQDLGIEYPVAQDNEGMTWKAYKNNYWPAIYLIDKFGHIRYIQIGEGAYSITEAAFQELLAEPYR
jgi:thiol-disulfide isomerase/thioredoxin